MLTNLTLASKCLPAVILVSPLILIATLPLAGKASFKGFLFSSMLSTMPIFNFLYKYVRYYIFYNI